MGKLGNGIRSLGVLFAEGAKKAWAFTVSLLTNPIVIFIAAVAALAAGVYYLAKALTTETEASEKAWQAMKRLNDERERSRKIMEDVGKAQNDTLNPQLVLIDKLVRSINSENTSLGEKKKKLEELIRLDPKYLNGLTLNNINTTKGVEITNNYIKALTKKAEAMALESQLVKLYSEKYTAGIEYENLLIGLQVNKIQLLNEQKAGRWFGDEVDRLKEQIKVEEALALTTKSRLDNTGLQIDKLASKLGNMQVPDVQFNTGDLIKATEEKNKKIAEVDKISEQGKWDWAITQYKIYLYQQEELKKKAREESNAAELKALEDQEDMLYDIYAKRMNYKLRAALDIIEMEQQANENAGQRIFDNAKALDEKYIEQRKQVFGGLLTIFDELSYDEKVQAVGEGIVAAAQIAADSINAIMSVQSENAANMFEEDMQRVSDSYDQGIKYMDDALKYGTLTQQEYDKRKINLDKIRAEEEKKLREFFNMPPEDYFKS